MSAEVLAATHTVLGWVLVLSNGAAGLWAIGAIRWPALRHGAMWWLLGAAWTLVFAQMTVGVAVMRIGGVDAPAFHVFYGVCCAVTVVFVYAYRQQLEHRRYELFGLGALFIMGLSIRAMFLGG
ncbi:hypothetical protein [Candidatus Poriferisodalis sp.]|uniref:hypothetical protein n=1 Tax=Candidatus Poriferisodalis sp. TaxID=3101277 RepID=UPI003B02430C